MDIQARDALGKLAKEITETGSTTLDDTKLKAIKKICKQSDSNVEAAFHFWFAQLKKEHAQIRYSCIQLAEHLVQRSHRFRTLLADEFPLFVTLTVGIHQTRLPPPADVAAKLREYALALVKDWYVKFGEKYRPFALGFDYLKHNGFMDEYGRQSLNAIHAHDRQGAERQARLKAIHERRFQQIKSEVQEHLDLIKENLLSMQGCFEILVPKNEETSIDFDALIKGDINATRSGTANGMSYKESIMSHGLASNRYRITIDLSENPIADQVHESEENKVVYEALRERLKLLQTKHKKQLDDWIDSISRITCEDKKGQEALLKQLIDVKNDMADAIRKSELLNIHISDEKKEAQKGNEEEEDDDEYLEELFEEVEVPQGESSKSAAKKRLEPQEVGSATIPSSKLPPAQRIFPLAYEPGMEEDVTYNRARVFPQPARSNDVQSLDEDDSKVSGKGKQRADLSREELLKRAPVVEWGDDLYYWDKNSVQFNTSGIERTHRFMGVGEGTNEMPPHLLEQLRKRAMYYKSQMPSNLKACRAPLKNGTLCPRRDLVICPFHGKIIPRDELGRPVNPADEKAEEKSSPAVASSSGGGVASAATTEPSSSSSSTELWQEIEGDVMQQVGQERIDTSKKRRRKKAEKPQSNLVDLRKNKENSYARLEKKLENPAVKRMIEEAADYERQMKSRDRNANIW